MLCVFFIKPREKTATALVSPMNRTDNKASCEKPAFHDMIIVASGTDASAGGGAVRPAKEKLYEIFLSRQSPVKPEVVKSLVSP